MSTKTNAVPQLSFFEATQVPLFAAIQVAPPVTHEQFKHWERIKKKYPDAVILYCPAQGSEYFTFREDAAIMESTFDDLHTKHDNIAKCVCSFGRQQLEWRMGKLTKAGHRVAIVDELSSPAK